MHNELLVVVSKPVSLPNENNLKKLGNQENQSI